MIDHYRVSLKYGTEKGFKGNPGYRMYGCLMELLPTELCERMHENVKTPISQNIEYSLNSSRYRLKSVGIRGFCGRITVSKKCAAPLREILAALFAFSEFNGVGVKMRSEWGKQLFLTEAPELIGLPPEGLCGF